MKKVRLVKKDQEALYGYLVESRVYEKLDSLDTGMARAASKLRLIIENEGFAQPVFVLEDGVTADDQ